MSSTPSSSARLAARFASRRWLWTFGVLAAFIALVVAFDWTWFRPAIQHYVHERSGRRIDFDKLQIRITPSLDPVVTFRGLLIDNASWAAPRPLARAAEMSFAISWRSIGSERLIVNRLTMVDADVDMEMQADGLRNWRITNPEYRGPGKVWILTIDAQRSGVRFVNHAIDLDLATHITALAPVQTIAEHPELPMTKWLVVKGSRGGAAFEASTAVSDVLSFRDTGDAFALRGTARTGRAKVDVEGTAADILQLKQFNVDMRATTPRIEEFKAFMPARAASSSLPTLAPIAAQAHLQRSGVEWKVSKLRATVGRSDVAGDVDFHEGSSAQDRPMLRATLNSSLIDTRDLVTLSENPKHVTPARPADAAELPPGRLLTARVFDTSSLNQIDADVNLRIDEFFSPALVSAGPLKTQASAHATVKNGLLDVTAAEMRIAGGRANGSMKLDSSKHPAEVVMDWRFTGLQVDQLKRLSAASSAALSVAPSASSAASTTSSSTSEDSPLSGDLDARVALRAHGDSLAALASAANGSVSAELRRASISKKLDAKLGLDGGALFRSWFAPQDRLQVTCSIMAIDFVAGQGKARRAQLETERTSVVGIGTIDLAHESFDLTLTPHRKTASLLALDRSVHAHGPWRHPAMSLVDPVPIATQGGCDDRLASDGEHLVERTAAARASGGSAAIHGGRSGK
jgi:uncharacterized protein involved in outer membrane biogenesis